MPKSSALILFVSLLSFCLFFPSKVLAVDILVSGMPSTVNYDQEVEVDLKLICNCHDSYFRGVFYPSGNNYFGFTKDNSGNWVGTESDKTKYFKVASDEIVDGSWSGKLKIKPDKESSYYLGTGTYYFKVGRYTSAGDSGADWSNELTMSINGAMPTPSPSPTSTPTPTPSPSPSPSPTPSPSLLPRISPSPRISPTPRVLSDETNNESLVAGLRDELSSPSPSPLIEGEVIEKKFSFASLFFMLGGVTFISIAGFSFIKRGKEGYTRKDEKISEGN